jgi:hypothetical protein
MKKIKIIELEDAFVNKNNTDFILRLPYYEMNSLEESVRFLIAQSGSFYGIISPYEEFNLEFNIRCAARIKDRLNNEIIYCAVPTLNPREKLQTIYRAGFKHIVVPRYLYNYEYDHLFSFVDRNTLDEVILHVAGGEFSSSTWNKENWSYSEEVL